MISIYKPNPGLTEILENAFAEKRLLIEISMNHYQANLTNAIYVSNGFELSFNRMMLQSRWAFDFSIDRNGPDSKSWSLEIKVGESTAQYLYFSVSQLTQVLFEIQTYKSSEPPMMKKFLEDLAQVIEGAIQENRPLLMRPLWSTQDYE